MCGRVFADYKNVVEPHPELDLYPWLKNLPESLQGLTEAEVEFASNWNLTPTQ